MGFFFIGREREREWFGSMKSGINSYIIKKIPICEHGSAHCLEKMKSNERYLKIGAWTCTTATYKIKKTEISREIPKKVCIF